MTGWVCNGVEFNVGDTVRVVRFEESGAEDGMGDAGKWDNTWTDGMDEILKYPTLTHQIHEINEMGVMFVNEPDCHDFMEYMYPLSVLEKVN